MYYVRSFKMRWRSVQASEEIWTTFLLAFIVLNLGIYIRRQFRPFQGRLGTSGNFQAQTLALAGTPSEHMHTTCRPGHVQSVISYHSNVEMRDPLTLSLLFLPRIVTLASSSVFITIV